MFIISLLALGKRNKAQNTQRIPTSKGHAQKIVQMIHGHPNNPTTPPDHTSPRPPSPALIGRLDPVRSIYYRTFVSCSGHWPVAKEQVQKNTLIWSHKIHAYMHLPFKAQFLFAFAYRIFNGFIDPARTNFSSAFSISF